MICGYRAVSYDRNSFTFFVTGEPETCDVSEISSSTVLESLKTNLQAQLRVDAALLQVILVGKSWTHQISVISN